MRKKHIRKPHSTQSTLAHSMRHQYEDKTTQKGLVITRHTRFALIEDSDGHTIRCAMRPHIDTLVAGDQVIWQAEGPAQGVILSVLPRQTSLGRLDAQGKVKPIAANITQMMIVIAPRPMVSWLLLDSYLLIAETLQLRPYIVLNKTDLDVTSIKQPLLQVYEPLGYPILFTHSTSADFSILQKTLRNQNSVFVGQSGVGKSSLIHRLLPNETAKIKTAPISEQSQLGCHTTSNSYLYHIPSGGDLIDSPGVREFSLWTLPQSKVAAGFREFRPYISHCKFRNCHHHHSPNCAIIQAVSSQQISLKRYENYVRILSNIDGAL